MLKVYNTLTRSQEEFKTIEPHKVRMYVCGPTVYDHAHIGHGRTYIVYDCILRYLTYKGYEVKYVRNITDIDDKIIKRANDEGVVFSEISETYTASYNEDMANLGLLPPAVSPQATTTIKGIIQFIETLIQKGHAYASDGDVYFSIPACKEYGKLSRRRTEDLKVGARVFPGEKKKDPLDFALWKKAKPEEPSWDSPWGKGRPGWHIECSAMAKEHLGESIDIHAGGQDLIFPHHENEIAQSEAANEAQFATYWFHNGFVNINKEKMSKSLGNMVNLKKLLSKFHAEAIKFYMLSFHYRSPIDFSDGAMEEAARGLDRMYRVLLSVPPSPEKVEPEGSFRERFEEAMDDDFNSAKAMGVLFEMVKEINRLQRKKETLAQAGAMKDLFVELGGVLGLFQANPEEYFKNRPAEGDLDATKVEQLIAERAEARREKNFDRADQIRDELTAMNVVVEDSPEGTSWRIKG